MPWKITSTYKYSILLKTESMYTVFLFCFFTIMQLYGSRPVGNQCVQQVVEEVTATVEQEVFRLCRYVVVSIVKKDCPH